MFIFLLQLFYIPTHAQDSIYTRQVIKTLCSNEFAGRGYVHHGMKKAARYLKKQYKNIGLQKVNKTYLQHYTYPINTFPKTITCYTNTSTLVAGKDFLIEPYAQHCKGKYQIQYIHAYDSTLAEKELALLSNNQKEAICFLQNDKKAWHTLFDKRLNDYNIHPPLIINTTSKKMNHDLSTEVGNTCVLLIQDSSLTKAKNIYIHAPNKFLKKYKAKNIIGYIPGKSQDSAIVFSAHYDHLGMLGDALFPGASDNASGVSMLLNLAKYYTSHTPEYNTYFILFSGEEAGLLGSKYYTQHPMFPLEKIKFLINIDIMGNAEKGITVVNGTVFEKEFNLLKKINDEKKYLPEVRIRGKAANSDHYFFTEKGVPSIFIYTMGGQGYYHDIDDTEENVLLTNYNKVYQLFIDFVNTL